MSEQITEIEHFPERGLYFEQRQEREILNSLLEKMGSRSGLFEWGLTSDVTDNLKGVVRAVPKCVHNNLLEGQLGISWPLQQAEELFLYGVSLEGWITINPSFQLELQSTAEVFYKLKIVLKPDEVDSGKLEAYLSDRERRLRDMAVSIEKCPER